MYVGDTLRVFYISMMKEGVEGGGSHALLFYIPELSVGNPELNSTSGIQEDRV